MRYVKSKRFFLHVPLPVPWPVPLGCTDYPLPKGIGAGAPEGELNYWNEWFWALAMYFVHFVDHPPPTSSWGRVVNKPPEPISDEDFEVKLRAQKKEMEGGATWGEEKLLS